MNSRHYFIITLVIVCLAQMKISKALITCLDHDYRKLLSENDAIHRIGKDLCFDHHISSLNNIRFGLQSSTGKVKLGFSIISAVADSSSIISFVQQLDKSPIFGIRVKELTCMEVDLFTMNLNNYFPKGTATFAGVRSLRSSSGYDPDGVNLLQYFASQDDMETHVSSMSDRTKVDIVSDMEAKDLKYYSQNDVVVSELALASGVKIICTSDKSGTSSINVPFILLGFLSFVLMIVV